MAAATKEPKKVKKGFKMPHLFWIMICLLFVSSLLTYVIPAGQFMTDPETGKILGDQFQYLGAQTPVSPLQVLLLLIDGLVNSSLIGWTVMVSGATVAIVMGTGAFDEFMNWAIYKLKDKDDSILIGVMFCLMVYLGAFGGSDALIAIVPIGVMFAKKLKLDPICAMGVSTYATLIGFGTGPTKQATTQMLMGVQIYGTFFTMFISMNIFMLAGLFFLLRYVKKIRKDPTLSPMWSEGWRPDEAGDVAAEEAAMLKEVKLSGRTILILIIYLMQYVVMVGYPMVTGDTSLTFKLMVAMGLITSISCGFIGGFSFDKIGNEFGKGLASMAFVAFVIGLANCMSLILTQGNILHTIVHFLTAPLMDLPRSVARVGMTAVISVVNLLIPSASSKAAILVPILQPVSEALGLMPELAVQAFQYGDGFSNMISPMLGWTVGSCVTAGLPFPKWAKWALPKMLCFLLIGFVIMFCLTEFGWQPF